MVWQIGPAAQHLLRRRPVWPLALVGDLTDAAPGEPCLAHSDRIAQRLAVAEYEVEPALSRADHDGAGLLVGGIAHQRAGDRGPEQGAEKRAAANVLVVGMGRG